MVGFPLGLIVEFNFTATAQEDKTHIETFPEALMKCMKHVLVKIPHGYRTTLFNQVFIVNDLGGRVRHLTPPLSAILYFVLF